MYGEHSVKIRNDKIRLPENFCAGKIGRHKEEGCLFVIPQTKGKVLALSREEKEFAKITDKALVVGCGNFFEIWNPQRFKNFIAKERMEEIAERLSIECF